MPTLRAAKAATICCQDVRVSGSADPVRADEKVAVLGRPFGVLAAQSVTSTTTDAGVIFTSEIAMTYTAQTDTATSSP